MGRRTPFLERGVTWFFHLGCSEKDGYCSAPALFFFFFLHEYPRPRPPISLSLQSQSVMVKPCCRPPSETPRCSFCTGQFSRLERSFGLARPPAPRSRWTCSHRVCWKNWSLPEAPLLLLLFPPGLRALAMVFRFHFM